MPAARHRKIRVLDLLCFVGDIGGNVEILSLPLAGERRIWTDHLPQLTLQELRQVQRRIAALVRYFLWKNIVTAS